MTTPTNNSAAGALLQALAVSVKANGDLRARPPSWCRGVARRELGLSRMGDARWLAIYALAQAQGVEEDHRGWLTVSTSCPPRVHPVSAPRVRPAPVSGWAPSLAATVGGPPPTEEERAAALRARRAARALGYASVAEMRALK